MKSWKEVSVALTAGLLLGGAVTVTAGTWISAYRNTEVQVTLNGEKQTFTDEKTGETMVPLTYQDRTYLPLRNIANLAGLRVDYDEETKTAMLETKDYVRPTPEVKTEGLKSDLELFPYMTKDKNYMVSPFSLRMAMMMAANGAEGKTKEEILSALNVTNLEDYNALAQKLIAQYKENDFVKLNVANSIWLNSTMAGDNVRFAKEYQELIAKYYDGSSQVEKSTAIVGKANHWIEDKTNGKIKNMLSNSDFLALLVNTIYFKGEWADQFEKFATSKEAFTDRNGKETEIDFMHKTRKYDYYEDETMQMVKLPYKGYRTAMYVVLPKGETKMDIEGATGKMEYCKVRLSLPKFKTEYDLSCVELLKMLGVREAFDENQAQFKNKMFQGMSGLRNVYIGDVLQKTFIEVDETGTEAAAATAVIMNVTSAMPMPEEIKDFKADRPFMYFIMDEESHQVLFMGEQGYAK